MILLSKIKCYLMYLIPCIRKRNLEKIITLDVRNNKDGTESIIARKLAKKYFNTEVGKWSNGANTFGLFNKAKAQVKIGRYSVVAKGTSYWGANHPVSNASVSSIFFDKRTKTPGIKNVSYSSLEIGNDVWIGTNVVITAGCKKIGDGVIIGAGAIVTKNIPSFSIVAGNPAKIIKYRFDDMTINLLNDSKWWTLDKEEILNFYYLIDSPRDFALKIIEYKKMIGK